MSDTSRRRFLAVAGAGAAATTVAATTGRAAAGETRRKPDAARDRVVAYVKDPYPHVAVVSRPVEGGSVPSVVFPELVEGSYELYEKGREDEVHLVVDICGGAVTTATWQE